VEAQVLVPQLELVLDPYKAGAHGLRPGQVVDAVTTLVNGFKVTEIHRDQKTFDVMVWAHPDIRRTWSDLKKLEIDLPPDPARPGGPGTIPLSAVAELQQVNAPNAIRHDKASRCIDVTCNIKGRDLGSAVEEIQQRVKALPWEE